MLKEFREFLMRGNLLELATAFIMGVAFASVVGVFTEGIVGGVIGAIVGEQSWSALNFDVNDSTIALGDLIGEVVNFVLVALVLFTIIRAYNRMRRAPEAQAEPTETELLQQIVEELRK
jgi:large conductance mechanosensitive channel